MSDNTKISRLWVGHDAPQGTSLVQSSLASLWSPINGFLEWFGELGIFIWHVMRATVRRPFEGRELIRQLDEVGSKSLPMVALAGAAIGAVLALESRHSLIRFGAKAMLPAAIVFSIIHETGPVVTGLVVSGRVGAGVLMLPLLTLAADFAGVMTGWIANTLAEPISLQKFLHAGFAGASFSDFLAPTFRTTVFGLIIGVIACFQGMRSQGGTEGVGRSATSSVVLSSLFVMLADVILTKLILVFFP
jgi:phospholipid/cholesterol/gamma-HCH transport system permease protein